MIRSLVRGDVVLAQFPFTDLKDVSLRPALVVSQGAIGQDVVLAGISSVVGGSLVPTDCMVDSSHPEFGWIRHLLERYRLSTDLRGDGIYAVGRKTGAVKERYPGWLYA